MLPVFFFDLLGFNLFLRLVELPAELGRRLLFICFRVVTTLLDIDLGRFILLPPGGLVNKRTISLLLQLVSESLPHPLLDFDVLRLTILSFKHGPGPLHVIRLKVGRRANPLVHSKLLDALV